MQELTAGRLLANALAGPLLRLDLVLRFFWPVIAVALFAIALGLLYWTQVLGLALPPPGQRARASIGNPGEGLLIFGFTLAAMLLLIALSVHGLIRWHRFAILDQPDGGSAAERAGRSWPLFGQWFVVGTAFAGWMVLCSCAASGLIAAIFAKGQYEVRDIAFSSNRTLLVGAVLALNALIALSASLAFALIFKRRSALLAHVAADAEPGEPLARLEDVVIPNRWFTAVLAASLFGPLTLLQAADLGVAQVLATLATMDGLQSRLLGMAIELLHLALSTFYPMLAFATAASVYYRDRIREGLLARLAGRRAAVDHAESAP